MSVGRGAWGRGWELMGPNGTSGASTPAATAACELQLLWLHGLMVRRALHLREGVAELALVSVGSAVGAADGVELGGADELAALLLAAVELCVCVLLMEQKTGFRAFAPYIFLYKCFMFI